MSHEQTDQYAVDAAHAPERGTEAQERAGLGSAIATQPEVSPAPASAARADPLAPARPALQPLTTATPPLDPATATEEPEAEPDSPLTSLASSPLSPAAHRPSSSPDADGQGGSPRAAKRPRVRSPSLPYPANLHLPLPLPPAADESLNPNYRVWTAAEDALLVQLRTGSEGTERMSFDEIGARLGRSTTAVSIRFYGLKRKKKAAAAVSGEEEVPPEGQTGGGAGAGAGANAEGTQAAPAAGAGAAARGASPSPAAAAAAAAAGPSPVARPAPRTSTTTTTTTMGTPDSSSSSSSKKIRHYTATEDALVASYRRSGLSAAAIGENLGRSTNSIYNRLTALQSMGMDVAPRTKVERKGRG